ncbi:MAG: glycosyltransferase family 4 protein [Sarcina sp.]
MKKKVLFIAHVQSHIMNFHLPYLEYFNQLGYEVYVATKLDTKKYDLKKRIDIQYINWVDIDYPRNPCSNKIIKALRDTIKILKDNNFEIIHTHTPVGGVVGRVANYLTNKETIIYTAHGFHFYKGAKFLNWILYFPIEYLMSKITNTIITINNEDYEIATKYLKNKNNVIKIDGVGVNLSNYTKENNFEIKEELGIKRETFIMTIVAELIERKNHIQIIEAMKVLNNKDIIVLIVGDGEKKDFLEKKVKEYGLTQKIRFLGFRHDVNKIINASDCVGLFSLQEGLPKNILEAMAVGKYVICTNVRGNRDLIKDKKNGALVQVGDINGTVKEINFAIKNKDEINKRGLVSLTKIERFSEDKILGDIEEVYKTLLYN